jgi:phosphatidylinositol alpha 1,6-mannosyltransferase
MERDSTRVLIVSESSLEQVNGVSGSVKQVSDYLRSHDHAVQIIAPKPKPHGGEYNGTKVVGVPKVSLQGFHVGIPTKSAVRAEVRTFQPDIIHFASPVSKLGNVGLKAAARLGIPTVAVYQTDVAQYAKRFAGEIVDRSSRKEIKWLKEGAGVALESLLGERIADLHNRADLTLAPSRSAVQRLIDFGVEPSKIKLWARGVDTELFTPERTTQPQVVNQRRAWRGDTERLVVGYVGRLAPEKSVHRLEALKKLRDIQLVVVGDGPSRAELESLLGDDVIFTGKLTGEALADAYAAFDLFVHTGAEETFGQTLQEAMATGLPVVAPAAGGPLDIVNNSVTGLLYSHDSDEQLVSSVETIIKDEALRRSMGNAGLQKVAGRTWDALGERQDEVR